MAATLSEEVMRMIRGEVKPEEKHQAYDTSLSSWWKEYASRKNDEEEEHVADSLLYDERCHLPRTIPPPDVVFRERAATAAAAAAAALVAPELYGHLELGVPAAPEAAAATAGEKRAQGGAEGRRAAPGAAQ
ncbi:hypothetical protein FOA52_007950 [Chlamydomonas sp. UWO 241]|nr:hypothetical protein FOA52_007950 [Chlamydomonas sp. UWO 241]